jgi:hypothetical protein
MFQEDKDMADQNEAKTKTIGFLPIEKVQTLNGWDEYADKSTKLSVLRTETQKAKNSVRDALKDRLNENGDIDFVVEDDRIRVFRVFRKQQQGRRTLDLSSSFREQPFERSSEPKGIPVGLEETISNNLDPVTERLLTLMREKGQR